MPLLMTNTPSPFGQSPPWAAGRTPPLAAAAGAQAWLVSMTAASKQEALLPLSEHYSEWLNACTLARWMDGLISKGHPAVHLRSAAIQQDCGNNAVIQGSTAVTFGGAPEASSEKM